jgi:hypothetical protein
VSRTRSSLYRLARALGDVEAVKTGRYPQRVVRKAVYRNTNRATRRLLKIFGL